MAEGLDLIAAAVLIDRIARNGAVTGEIIGGAGLHALSGAALWSRSPLLVTGIGEDIDDAVGPWLDRNRLSRAGLRIEPEPTARNMIEYRSDTERTERPLFGPEHFDRLKPRFSDMAPWLDQARSAYVFGSTTEGFWEALAAARARHGFFLFWEISSDACFPDNLPMVAERLACVDAFSLNEEEAAALFGLAGPDRLLAAVATLPVTTVFLRAGRRGSYLITRGSSSFVPGHEVDSVDVTGAGNAYCGGALAGLAQGHGPVAAGQMGTIAAAFAVGQLGPADTGSNETQRLARAALEAHRHSAGRAMA